MANTKEEKTISVGDDAYVYEKDLDDFFGIYKQKTDGAEVNLLRYDMDGIVPVNLTDDMRKLIKRAQSVKHDKDYRYNMHTFFPNVPLKRSDKSLKSGAHGRSDVSTPGKGNMVPDEERDHAAAVTFDIMDEEQIMEMLEGRANKNYIYSFPMGGKTVEGISYAGTIDAANFYSEKMTEQGYGPLEVVDTNLIETADAYRVFVRVKNGKSGLIIPGFASQKKKMRVYTDKSHTNYVMKDDEKADVKCVSKATRNGLRNSMPATYVDAYIQMVKQGKRK